jgi:tRNA(Ile2) C34 agmatinyltransferase TiaS
MGSLSIWHWVIFIFFILVLGIPIARKLTRIGHAEEKTCPRCAEQIKAAALVCRFCGYEFPKSPSDALGRMSE